MCIRDRPTACDLRCGINGNSARGWCRLYGGSAFIRLISQLDEFVSSVEEEKVAEPLRAVLYWPTRCCYALCCTSIGSAATCCTVLA
eukprot:3882917-Rhodomonas_salina.4